MFRVQMASVKREEGSQWELCLSVGNMEDESKVLMAQDFTVIPAPVWDFRLQPYDGLQNFGSN